MIYKILFFLALISFVGFPNSTMGELKAQDTTEVDEGTEVDRGRSSRGRGAAVSRGGSSSRGGRSSARSGGSGESFWKKLFSRKSNRNQDVAREDRTRVEAPGRRIEKLSQEELNYEFLVYARRGNLKMVRGLLEEGALINSRDRHERTALIEAARTGNIELCKLLLDMGASVSLKDMYDGTAIMYASKAGHVDVVNLLLKNGARNEQY